MADDNMDVAKRLENAVPIAQLSPDTPRDSAVHGMITIVWPFNKVNNSVAFILAEPEARLRLAKGQIRVNCVSASAKAISECGLGSGDKVRLSLEGAEFVANDAKSRTPGTESEWQLSFSKRLILQAKIGYTEETRDVNVDALVEPEAEPLVVLPVPEPEIELDIPLLPSATPMKNNALQLKDGEFESPAFVKRARISYGGLFEGDLFEDDGGIKGKGRKKTRFSLDPRAWRYTSRSPSPEESPEEDTEDGRSSPVRPQMADGECQTMELDFPGPPPEQEKPQDSAQPNPFHQTGTVVNQGQQTVSQGTWTAPEPQEQFIGLLPNPPKPVFGNNAGIQPEHAEWNQQPLPEIPIAYPELSHDTQMPYDSSLERPFESQIPNGFGFVPPHDSFVQPHPFAFDDSLVSTNPGIQTQEQSLTTYPGHEQSSTVYPDPEHYDAKPNSQVPQASPFIESSVPLAEATVTVPADPYAREASIPSERAALNAGTSAWTTVNQRDGRSLSRPVSSRHSGDGQTPQSAMVIDESDSDAEASLVDAAHGSLGDAPVSRPAQVARELQQAAQNPFIQGPPPGHDVTEEDWEEEVHAYAGHAADRYDDEYDEDEDGGDYDTSNYLAPQDDEDDGDDMDLRQHPLEPEFNDGEEQSWDEDGEEYDEDDYDEDEEEEEEEPEINRPPPRPASSAPVVIDLLSDSDDEDDEPPRPPPSTMPAVRPQPSMQATSPDYGPGSKESEEEEGAEVAEVAEEESEESEEESEDEPIMEAGHDSEEDGSDIDVQGTAEVNEILDDSEAESEEDESDVSEVADQVSQLPTTVPIASDELKDEAIVVGQPQSDEQQQPYSSQQEQMSIVEQPVPTEADHEPTEETDHVPEIKSSIDIPSSPPLTRPLLPPVLSNQDVVMEDASPAAPKDPLPTPAETQPTKQPEETAMEIDNVTQSSPEAIANNDTMDDEDSISDEIVVATDEPEQPKSPGTQPMSSVDALNILADAVPEDVIMAESKMATKANVEEAEISQVTDSNSRSFVFESGETIQDVLESSPFNQSQSTTPFPVSADVYDIDDVVSLASQLSGDDALQAALRDEDTREYDSDGYETTVIEFSQDQESEAVPFTQSFQEPADTEPSPVETQDHEMLDEEVAKTVDTQDEPAPASSPASMRVKKQADARDSSPNLGVGPNEHVNEAGLPMNSPEWTVKELHEHEEPDVRRSPAALRATPVTHKNEAGLTVGSPERAAIERHQEEGVLDDSQPAQEKDENKVMMGSPERAAIEQDQEESAAIGPEAVQEQTETEPQMGSPERAAIERHQEQGLSDEPEPAQEQAETEHLVGSPERAAIERHQDQEPKEVPGTTPVQPKAEEPFIGSPEKTAKRRFQQNHPDSEEMASDPSLRLARAAIASRNGRQRGSTPDSRPQTRSKSFQKTPSPELPDNSVQLARAALSTPSKTTRNEAQALASSPTSSKVEEETSSLTASKLKLVRHLRDQLPECNTLKVLRQHTGKSVEVMAVAMMTPPTPVRAKGGPREYVMSFTITDHSISPSGVCEAQLYRPHKESLPQVKHGDVVLLRSFTVVALKGKGYGLRTNEGSSWAVFDREDEAPQIKGPPVEYGEAETIFAAYLREWYGLLDDKAKQKLEKANQKIVEAGKAK
ncbi:hypothetical protein G7054_g13444 [Neopestalotiopsis clavispora]|nr:hypothetical protein G7054_g13444 [Neopestalotiopsis clavispora]